MVDLRKLILIIIVFVLVACSQNPSVPPDAIASFTPASGGTQSATIPPTIPGLSETPPALPTIPSLTPTIQAATPFPEGFFSPVLFVSKDSTLILLAGGYKVDQGWLDSVQAANFINGEMQYDFFGPSQAMQVRMSPPQRQPPCGTFAMQSSVAAPETMVGLAGGWNPERRNDTLLAVDDPAYVQAVTEWFQSRGNSPKSIRITRILQTDLEGDGVNEILLSASYFGEKFSLLTETGDYSVVLMRKLVGNSVVTVPLVNDYYVSSIPEFEVTYPLTYTLEQAIDINHDGILEVVVSISRWEGGGVLVYRVDGQNVREVMRAIC